ncbi:central domain of glycogen debranching enzyme-domain-containing protein, partial [Endogone sp. FLAS-F59071]
MLRGTDAELIFGYHLVVSSRENRSDAFTLRGLATQLEAVAPPNIRSSSDTHGPYTEIIVPPVFPSGAIMLFRIWVESSPEGIHGLVSHCHEDVFKGLDLVDMNAVLYRCDGEERDVTENNGTYNIPAYGALPYCGLEGFIRITTSVIPSVLISGTDIGHLIMSYTGCTVSDGCLLAFNRHLKHHYPRLKLRDWFQTRFDAVKQLPNFLPKYFALIIRTAYIAAREHTISLMSPLITKGDRFTHSLGLCSVQMYGQVTSASLHPTNPSSSMAAGLPHFAQAHMRCWGRDVFISLRGLFLTTGHYDAARRHIIAFASSLKHGLIPNLLNSVRY